MIDYEQGDLNYRVAHWGDYFPESTIEVLEWVESLVLPSEYVGTANGEAKYADNSAYVESAFLDTQSGLIKTKYYYWVKNKTTVDTVATRRTNSIKTLEKLISDPTGQGIPYMAVIASNAISIFNINSLLGANNKILKIEYAQTLNQSISHSEFELVQQNNSLSLIPDKLIEKLIDSMSGENSIGEVVPDLRLKDNSKLGISRRPRQTMIQYTDAAIKIFVEYVNAFLIQNLATQLFDLSGLVTYEPFPPNASGYYNEKVATLDQLYYIDLVNLLQGHKVLVEADSEHEGFWTIYEYFPENVIQWQLNRIQSYDSTRYWQYADWYATGYDQNIKIDYIVQEFKDIAPLGASAGSVVKILDNGLGNFELYLLVANSTPQIVGVQNGTIQLKTNLYDGNESLVGFDNASFDSIGFSKTSAIELRNIISGLFSGVFTGVNQVEINKLFFVMVNYILSEQRSVDWVFKSSFISVLHQIRKLEEFPSYIKDQQSYFEDYINEVKPYRTQIRNYLLDYQGFDTALQGVSDFDLLPVFDAKLGVYRALNIHNITDLALIKSTSSKSWLDNYTYSIQAIRIVNGGTGYTSAPRIEITGGGGTGAVATATIDISTGELIDINVINAGSGFTGQPTVNFYGGSGTGAKAYVDFAQSNSTVTIDTKNKKTRSITTQLNFDRTAYQSSVSQWKSYTTYHPGDIVAVPDVVLTTFVNLPDQLLPRYTNAYQIQPNKRILGSQTVNFNIFQDETVAIKLSGRDITNALDRLALYNKPGSPDIARIFSSPDTQRLDPAAINDLARSAGNEWNAVTHSQVVPATHEYQYLAVGDRSLLAISQDGITWELIIVNENFVNLRDACFFNGTTWVAVGNQASLLLSDNGVNWTKEVVDNFSFSPTVDNPTGAVQQNISQALDFTSVAYIDSARGNYVIAVGNGSNVLMNPYDASVDIPQGWYSAKPQSKLFVVPAQFLKVYSKSFGPLTNIDGTTYNVLLQLSGYSIISASPLALTLREGFVIIGGTNGNMFITSYTRLDDLMQGYANSYNYDSGKRANTNYPWVPMSVPTEIAGVGDGTSGEQIQGVAISDKTDRWIVAVGSAGTLLWNRLDSPIRIQAGSSDLGSDTINTTVVDYDINVFANFRYFNASNFVAPLTKDSISKINLTDITWDGEKFVVVGDSSTVIWGYPGSQSNASIEIGNVNPNITAVTLLPTASWTTVTAGTSVTITVPVADLKGPVLTGMIVSAVGLPTDSVVASSSVVGANYLIVVNFATATFSSGSSKALSLLYAVTSSIPAGTVLTFTGPNGQTKTLTTSRTTAKGSRTIDVSDFAGVIASNWTVSGTGIPVNAIVLQVKKFAEFTWQYAKGSGRDVNVDYNSVSVNLTTFKISNGLAESTNFARSQAGSTIIAGDLITLFDSTGTKIQVTATQTLLPGVSTITVSPSDLTKISAGYIVQANSIQGIAESTLVSNTINYNVAGLLNHLAKDINDLVPGTAYAGTQVTGKAYTDTTTDILNLDTNITSEYTDSALGTRPEDIIIAGGKYIDTYSSHAPEELVPGQVIDSLQMNVFTAKVVNGVPDYTNIIGYKIFTDYKLPTVYYRISDEYTTVLSADLNYDDTEIFVDDITKLPEPNRIQNQPGSIWINSERINYFGRDVATGKLTDIRRGASRTSIPLLHPAGVIITDASPSQEVTRDTVLTITSDVSVNNGLGDTATYQSVITPTVPQGKIWLET